MMESCSDSELSKIESDRLRRWDLKRSSPERFQDSQACRVLIEEYDSGPTHAFGDCTPQWDPRELAAKVFNDHCESMLLKTVPVNELCRRLNWNSLSTRQLIITAISKDISIPEGEWLEKFYFLQVMHCWRERVAICPPLLREHGEEWIKLDGCHRIAAACFLRAQEMPVWFKIR